MIGGADDGGRRRGGGARRRSRCAATAGSSPTTTTSSTASRVRTLRPARRGARCATFATVNDVHFGEVECGIIEGLRDRARPSACAEGAEPYPVIMNRGAIAEIQAIDPAAVVVKGDLTAEGTVEEYQDFLDAYRVFGERLHHVRGNHDVLPRRHVRRRRARSRSTCPACAWPCIDTAIPGASLGRVTRRHARLARRPGRRQRPARSCVFGHHHVWDPASRHRPDDYFGINPDDSERLIDAGGAPARRSAGTSPVTPIATGCGASRRPARVPWVEVACVKDYPGSWAEYRVYEGGVLQIHRRISSPEALAWTEQTRHMFAGTYADYALGRLEDRCFAITG